MRNRRAANVLGRGRRSAAERRRQNMALEALVKRRASNVLRRRRRRATEKRRQSMALGRCAKKRASNIVASAGVARGGDGADARRGAAARAVPARLAPPRHVPRLSESGGGHARPRGRAPIRGAGAERRAARRAAPAPGCVERRRLHARRGRATPADLQGAVRCSSRHGTF